MSANRQLPSECGGYNIFTGEPIFMTGAANSHQMEDSLPAAAHPGPGSSNEKTTMTEKKLVKCEAHERAAIESAEEAKRNFFSGTNLTEYVGENGEYHIRAFVQAGENSEMEHRWPMAFVGGESQTVNAAMWLKRESADAFVLVAVWTFSATRDKNNNYYLGDYSKDVFAFCSKWACGTNWNSAPWEEHFSVSQDYWTEHFYCAPLSVISLGEMDELRALNPNPTPAQAK